MLKRILVVVLFFCMPFLLFAQANEWQIVAGKIRSTWADQVDPGNPLPEYPRPQMERANWQTLNGLWSYAILAKGSPRPATHEGNILVPFAVESALSGVGREVGTEQELWYRKIVQTAKPRRNERLLLHFGAVDWETEVFVNGTSVGLHQGGFDPFYFDITDYLTSGRSQTIDVRVWDPTDDGPQPRGKQVKSPHGIWYTPVTGIWQSVWLETVPESHITDLRNTAIVDQNAFSIRPFVQSAKPGQRIRVRVLEAGKLVGEREVSPGNEAVVPVANPKLWSPDTPVLYDVEVILMEGRRVVDQVKSYAAMRKISMATDKNGIQRMMLNDEFLFQYGPLDQGWWPDGLYTAPTEEALLFDIVKTQEMGFNMIRKHVKVEPARWYYHCDRLGMLVWQDMPSGDMGNRWESRPGVLGKGTEKVRTTESESIFRKEWKAIMDANYHFPSIVVWVPFNEAWGQFKTEEIVDWTVQYDPTRLVNGASGGNYTLSGQIMDMHNYPDPVMPDPQIWGRQQIIVLGEYGGLGLPVEGHTWQEKDNWGYQSFKDKTELSNRYHQLINDLKPLIPMGLSAAIYTQTTDVEVEVNGLMTYDRKILKFDPDMLKALHQSLYDINLSEK
ncbi:MAG: beta-galactosidase [Lunatimonas sp.]|uniref:glycoside hydrolase family 2 protein n=1 Tax=Lunatimonas sp. TaxID=2060141 RepID=UPI00263B6B04|nr:sugar-binding domain-containing protein [Lunatimonas sp.]MCC5939469.1 beta-galactosidase [Lunatimonas sp.]